MKSDTKPGKFRKNREVINDIKLSEVLIAFGFIEIIDSLKSNIYNRINQLEDNIARNKSSLDEIIG